MKKKCILRHWRKSRRMWTSLSIPVRRVKDQTTPNTSIVDLVAFSSYEFHSIDHFDFNISKRKGMALNITTSRPKMKNKKEISNWLYVSPGKNNQPESLSQESQKKYCDIYESLFPSLSMWQINCHNSTSETRLAKLYKNFVMNILHYWNSYDNGIYNVSHYHEDLFIVERVVHPVSFIK